MRQMRTFMIAMLCILICGPATAASPKSWGTAGDYVSNGLVVLALGLPVVQQDWSGTLQAGGSVGTALLTVTGLKETFPEMRPDRSDDDSFPSGHTTKSFAAAATLHNRYGWQVGVPAQLAAAFVGVSRVKARKHSWHDALVGALIGEAAGFLLTSKYNDSIHILPWGDARSGGITLSTEF